MLLVPIGQFGTSQKTNELTEGIQNVNGIYLGAVDEEEINAIYNLCDVFVMPTISVEMFGMSAVEAQACGKPVIASDHGGLKETVPNDCGGRFETGKPEKLVEKILELVDDPLRVCALCTSRTREFAALCMGANCFRMP